MIKNDHSEIDELFMKLYRDNDLINKEMVKHGHCLRLFVSKETDTWLFQDGYRLEVRKGELHA